MTPNHPTLLFLSLLAALTATTPGALAQSSPAMAPTMTPTRSPPPPAMAPTMTTKSPPPRAMAPTMTTKSPPPSAMPPMTTTTSPPPPAMPPMTTTTSPPPPAMPPMMAMGPSTSEAFPPAQDCQTVLFMNLGACLDFVTKGSNLTVPGKQCCSGFKNVVDNNPICLCTLLNNAGNAVPGIEVDAKRALRIPKLCKVTTPSPDLCALLNGPTPAPTPSAGGDRSASPVGGPSSSMGGLSPASGPSTAAPSSSDGVFSTLGFTANTLIIGISVAIAATS